VLIARFAAVRSLAVLGAAALLSGCVVSLIGAKAGEALSAAVLNQSDPDLVADGVPAYLLIVDGLISQHPLNPGLLSAGAQMFALYGSRFAPHDRAIALTEKARRYGQKSLCLVHEPACHWQNIEYDRLVAELKDVGPKQIGPLYAYAVGWLANLNATSEDWSAVADLPWVQAVLERVVELDDTYQDGAPHGYLGILNALRPPALGGRPEVAQQHFEHAIELSEGRDLSIKVEYARRYARLVFDQELHDRLLNEVLNAPAESPGHTLFNVLAKKEAAALLATSKEYF
jgi:hypothetical protein